MDAVVNEDGAQASARHEQAAQTLSGIRSGQPAPDLMQSFSRGIQDISSYLAHEFTKHNTVVRLVVGEMGTGKTTLAQLIERIAQDNGAVPVRYEMPHLHSLSLRAALNPMLCVGALYGACFERIAAYAAGGDGDRLQRIRDSLRPHRFGQVLEPLVSAAEACGVRGETPDNALGMSLASSLSAWLIGDRCSPLQELVVASGKRAPIIGKLQDSEVLDLFVLHMGFFSACGVYPVWLVDEFESVTGLNKGKMKDLLGFIRDVVDSLSAKQRSNGGSIFLFSTGDGVNALREYPALFDRLQGSPGFLISSPTWNTSAFSQWDHRQVVRSLIDIYQAAALAEDYVAMQVSKHLGALSSEEFDLLAMTMIDDPEQVGRLRLKGLVLVIDHLASGPEAFSAAVCSMLAPIRSSQDDATMTEMSICASTGEDLDIPSSKRVDALQDFTFSMDAMDLPELINEFENLVVGEGAANKSTQDRELDLAAGADNGILDEEPALPEHTGGQHMLYSPRILLSSRIAKRKVEDAKTPAALAQALSALRDAGGLSRQVKIPASYRFAEQGDKALIDLGRQVLGWPCQSAWSNRDSALCNSTKEKFSVTVSRLTLEDNPDFIEWEKAYGGSPDAVVSAEDLDFSKEEALDMALIQPATARKNKTPKAPSKRCWVVQDLTICPFQSIGDLRHFIYTVLAHQGVVPDDGWVDALVLSATKFHFSYTPRPSRSGVQFLSSRVLHIWERRVNYADEAIFS